MSVNEVCKVNTVLWVLGGWEKRKNRPLLLTIESKPVWRRHTPEKNDQKIDTSQVDHKTCAPEILLLLSVIASLCVRVLLTVIATTNSIVL